MPSAGKTTGSGLLRVERSGHTQHRQVDFGVDGEHVCPVEQFGRTA